jgi:hypothetical protein
VKEILLELVTELPGSFSGARRQASEAVS